MRKRLLSALVLAPLALLATYLGYPYWDALVACLGVLMGWEWVRLCGGGRLSPVGIFLIAGLLVALAVAELWGYRMSLIALSIAGTAIAALASRRPNGHAIWLGVGIFYVGLPCLALIWIRAIPDGGRDTLLWILGLVWATDTAAYFAGRAIGGPKLAPRISPNKTWAGLAGGVLAAAGVGLVFVVATSSLTPWLFVSVSAGLAVVEQVGDLFESGVKRHFGVKDSGNLIPGHGGILDRVDGLLAVAITVASLTLIGGYSPLSW